MNRPTVRALIVVFVLTSVIAASTLSLQAECTGAVVASGKGTLTAPGLRKQNYTQFPIDLTGYERGVLIIKITLGSGESFGSFDLFPEGVDIPTVGDPVGTLKGAYDIRPGTSITMTYPFLRPGRFIFGATGNWDSRAGLTNDVSFVAYVENGVRSAIPKSGARYCCTLGQTSATGGGALDPAKLSGHKYGNDGFTLATDDEPMGFVYTTNAGLLDIGHVRDNADMTRALYFQLAGTRVVALDRPGAKIIATNIPVGDPAGILDLASAIAYVDAWEHELDTWEDLTGAVPQDPSSFSPEDLTSNMVGIELGRRVIKEANYLNLTDAEFNRCVDTVMTELMIELNARPAGRTSDVLSRIEGKGGWFTETLGRETLLLRNFDGLPWIVRNTDEPPTSVPAWLTADRFKSKYGQFLFLMKNTVRGSRVPPGAILPLSGNLEIRARDGTVTLTCADLIKVPAQAVIQFITPGGRSTTGQLTCAADNTGRATLTTMEAATNAIQRPR